jgi:hypothetical protein
MPFESDSQAMDRDRSAAGIAVSLVLTTLLLYPVVRLVRAVETIAEDTARAEADDADG